MHKIDETLEKKTEILEKSGEDEPLIKLQTWGNEWNRRQQMEHEAMYIKADTRAHISIDNLVF